MSFDAPTVTQRLIAADLLTPSYRIVGQIMVPNTGVIGIMNDTTNSYIEVVDARLARVHMPTKLVAHFEVIRMVKKQIVAVCVKRREDLGPQALARGGYGRIMEYPAQIISQVYEIEGTIEWAGRFDFAAIMAEGTRDFVPVYRSKLTAILIPALKIESPAMLVNRTHVDMLGLVNQKLED
jgi:hypothetical protein